MPTPNLPSDVRSAETPKDLSRWHSKKEVLYNLYIHRRRTLSNVKEIMESNHDFPTTLKLSDYEHVLREVFRFRKNLSADEWCQSIGPRIARREAAGKQSIVLLNGSEVKNFHRRIQRSSKNKSSRRRAKAHTATLPYGVVIRTPSPQPLVLTSFTPFGRDPTAYDIEKHEGGQSSVEFFADYKSDLDWLSSLMDMVPLSRAVPGAKLLSAQLLRENCPINELLLLLNEYQYKFNHVDLRLFGPNATIDILGKICFDFSNNLQEDTISETEMTSIFDWIGFSADITSLESFFSQKVLTILAAWEALRSTIIRWRHAAAFDVLLSVYSSIQNEVPWNIMKGHDLLSSCLRLAPTRVSTLINIYSWDQWQLDDALSAAISDKGSIELVKKLIDTGASFMSFSCDHAVNNFIRHLGTQRYEAVDLALLDLLLEDGTAIDHLHDHHHYGQIMGWRGPEDPVYHTDYLLLSGGQPKRNDDLWLLILLHSNRQQTTMTVPGIFEAAQGGYEQLCSYLNTRSKPYDDQDRKLVLEIALSEAAGRGYANMLQSLLQYGVDPNVRMLPKLWSHWPPLDFKPCHEGARKSWHPVIRAANAGKVDTLRILVTVSTIEIPLLSKELLGLDLCALRNMESSQLDHILRLLLTLNLATTTRSDILLNALQPHTPRLCGNCNDEIGLEFVKHLLELGFAFLDHETHLHDRKVPQLLVRAIRNDSDIRALNYLVEQDTRLLSAVSTATALGIQELVNAALCQSQGRHTTLELLAQKFEGVKSYVQECGSSLLVQTLQHRRCCSNCQDYVVEHKGNNNCEALVTVKCLLGLGATLDISSFTQLTRHASESFMLAILDSVPNIKAVDKSFALTEAIRLGRLKLAVSLIERGGIQINDGQSSGNALQQACQTGAPLWFIRFLIDKGADVNACSKHSFNTALQSACQSGATLSCIHFLLNKGADVNAPPSDDGLNALQYAAENGSMNTVGLLLDYGADVNGLSGWLPRNRSFDYKRAIDIAAQYSKLDMVHFLIAAGARSGVPGLTGFDGAITLATGARHFAIAALLQKHAGSHREARMEAERRWLQANPYACMYEGRIELNLMFT